MIHKGHVAGVGDQRRWFALWPPPSAGGFRPATSVPVSFPLFERLQLPARVKAGRLADKHDHLFEFSRSKLGNDFIDGALMQQKDSRDDVLANALSGSPAHRIRMKLNTETIRHSAGRYTGCGPNARGGRPSRHRELMAKFRNTSTLLTLRSDRPPQSRNVGAASETKMRGVQKPHRGADRRAAAGFAFKVNIHE
jgi:hypothetical protein